MRGAFGASPHPPGIALRPLPVSVAFDRHGLLTLERAHEAERGMRVDVPAGAVDAAFASLVVLAALNAGASVIATCEGGAADADELRRIVRDGLMRPDRPAFI